MGQFLTVNFYEIQSRNRWRTAGLLLGFGALLGLMGWAADVYTGSGGFYTAFALLYAGVQSAISYFWGDRMVLWMMQARPANPEDPEERRLIHVVEEMAIAAGIPRPRVYVIPDPSPNAFATGRDPDHASVAVTEGLMALLNREELQAVVAHEVAHIRHRDILVMTLAATLAGAIVMLADMLHRTLFYTPTSTVTRSRRSSRREREGGGGALLLLALVIIVLAPILARLLALAVSRAREYLADAGAAELTRNPLALARALEKIALSPPMRTASAATAHLFIAEPNQRGLSAPSDSLWSNLWSTHPPIVRRIELLRAMAGRMEGRAFPESPETGG